MACETPKMPAAHCIIGSRGRIGERDGRRRKTAAERRAQQVRSNGRHLNQLIKQFNAILLHRGGALSPMGKEGFDDLDSATPNTNT